MCQNRTSVWKIMTIWISRKLPLFNFERLDMLCAWIGHVREVMTIWIARELPLFNFKRFDIICARIGHPCEKLGRAKFLESFGCSISSVSIYLAPESDLRVKSYDHLNFKRASLLNFKRLYIWCPWIRHPSKKLLSFEFAQSFCFKLWASRYITGLNRTYE